ncbi:hypothetical protein Q1695_016094 [Nippostrongylus brasiliensis]|nr:hypothetical protein Q1695_016094 [Nippostrongylus brasiliensis]
MFPRYDCRLLLPPGYNANISSAEEESCPTEDLEEEMCDEERYRDMTKELPQSQPEKDDRPKKVEIGFDYGTNSSKPSSDPNEAGSDDSDSEAEPFEPPQGIKLPLGLVVPENQKQNHIIERTALFVVTKGPQMEIVIKAKQRNNTEQFGFLEFDNPLHPYYKYLSKLIREKKYTPNLSKHAKKNGREQATSSPARNDNTKKSNSLTALASQHESDSDSDDSDCELHPSLVSRPRATTRSPDLIDSAENAVGPRRRPASPTPPPVTAHRHDYDMSKSNDIYASLFKSLSQVSVEREQAEIRKKEKAEIEKHIAASAPPPPDEDYQAWWLSFYGTACPFSNPQPMVPPPPDLQPVISSYADFVARRGAEAELELRDRADLQLTFMHPTSPHFSYYQHQVRMVQWELAHKAADEQERQAQQSHGAEGVENDTTSTATAVEEGAAEGVAEDGAVPSTSSSLPDQSGALMNRKQRRRLQDAFKVGITQPVGIVDPVAAISLSDPHHIPKVSSSPAFLASPAVLPQTSEDGSQSDSGMLDGGVVPAVRPFPTIPVSFSLAPIKEETSAAAPGLVAITEEPGSSVLVDPRTLSPLSAAAQMAPANPHIIPPPVPPNILSNTQLDRKEKARIFMERLLNEKRVKKLREQEEARIRELEAQKAEIERQLAEEDAKRKKTSLAMVDKLINSRIGALLGKPETKDPDDKCKLPSRLSDDEAEKDRDEMRGKRKKEKSKKHKSKKSRSRSRSRSKDRERRRKRHTSDRSRERESKKHKKDRR